MAVRGATVDGHELISKAVEAGAAAIVAEDPKPADFPEDVAWILVPDSREALGLLSAAWFGNPSADLRVAGVTGTNGKTTTAWILRDALKQLRRKAGYLGTLGYDFGLTGAAAVEIRLEVGF